MSFLQMDFRGSVYRTDPKLETAGLNGTFLNCCPLNAFLAPASLCSDAALDEPTIRSILEEN